MRESDEVREAARRPATDALLGSGPIRHRFPTDEERERASSWSSEALMTFSHRGGAWVCVRVLVLGGKMLSMEDTAPQRNPEAFFVDVETPLNFDVRAN